MPFSGNGTGSSVDKYQVSTPQHLIDFLNQEGGNTVDTWYEQINDIDMNGVTVPRPAEDSLHNYDGQGFKISNMSRVATASDSREALLSIKTGGGIWENIILENPYLEALNTTKGVRALVVGMNRGGTYRNVSVVGGELKSAEAATGTFVGQNLPNNDAGLPAGGTYNCRSTATLTHTATTDTNDIGGFVADMKVNSNPVDKCYYAGSISIGAGNTSSAIGGFCGNSDEHIDNSFYDREVGLDQTGIGPRRTGTPKTTAEMQTLATYTDIFVQTETGVVTAEGTTTVTYVSGDNFSTLTVGDPFYLNGFKYEVATIVSNTELTLNTAASTIVSVAGESLGTGDGITTVFNTANTPVRSGTDVVRIDGSPTTAYTIDLATGSITFDTAPADTAVLTVDYDYLSNATYQVGTGSIGLTSAYDMVLEGDHVAQTWFLPTSLYPRLYFEDKTFLLSGAITKDGVLQAGVVVQVTAYDDYTMATGKQVVGNYVTDVNGVISIPYADVPAGKKLLLTPHNEDTGTLSSDQAKFVSDNF